MKSIKQAGFTLMEMVVTIIVVGIIFLGIANFVEIGAKGYGDSIDRQKLQNQARFVIEKIAREIRHAVPNSFTVDGKCLSFYPIKYAGFYHQNESLNPKTIEFVIGEKDIASPPVAQAIDYIVINPSQPLDLERNVNNQRFKFEDATQATQAEVDADPTRFPAGSGPYFTINKNLGSNSIAGRHYVYELTNRGLGKVTYCIEPDENGENDKITRHQYELTFESHPLGEPAPVQVGENIVMAESHFRYDDNTLQRGGLVHLDFLFERGGEQSAYKHDIQVMNVQ